MMRTLLRVIDDPGPLYASKVRPGDMWRDPDGDWQGGECWRIILPNGMCWCTSQEASNGGGRWKVTGNPPEITVHPSIFDHSPGREWHGWIQGGVLTDA